MTTKERLHQLVDALPDTDAVAVLEYIETRVDRSDAGVLQRAGLQALADLRTIVAGQPMVDALRIAANARQELDARPHS
ncbi:MAG: hypothetical protein M3071_25285 [Actinomycetota bacterium]|nr:hypothetical protein [Actinomycetota bacterium]